MRLRNSPDTGELRSHVYLSAYMHDSNIEGHAIMVLSINVVEEKNPPVPIIC